MELSDLIYLGAMTFYAQHCNEYSYTNEAMDEAIKRARDMWKHYCEKGRD